MGKISDALVPRMERINLLMDIYGDLLTEKQKRFVRLHYSEDLSFGEIASQFGVSRQAIYDAVKHALANLERYESTLALLGKIQNDGPGAMDSAGKGPDSKPLQDLDKLAVSLNRIKAKIQRQSIIYNVDWIVHDLNGIISRMEALLQKNSSRGLDEE